ncbi:MAG: YdcF family protein [Alphaproteobacteria bacterium]|jgi:uncharacterized SAM-binding protein YcdF (DUF218 family)|nr:YdcF family protein [Alphaproteobacteria bacterium]
MKDLLTATLLPPGLFLVLLILALVFWRRKKLSFVFVCAVSSLFWIFSTEAFGRFLSAAIIANVETERFNDVDTEEVDLIVVLTGGMRYVGDVGWQPRHESYKRGAVALTLQNHLGSRVPVMLSGGHTEGLKHPSEAAVLKAQFDTLRAQVTPVVLEEASTNTYESALQVAHEVRSRNVRRFFLVTDEVHMARALATYRGRGLDPIPFPVFTLERGPTKISHFFPSIYGINISHDALYEVLGIMKYAMTDKLRFSDL